MRMESYANLVRFRRGVTLVEMLIVVEPELVTDVGLNEAVTPAGSPVTLKFTIPLNPVPAVTVAS
jgi:hypothetical protein